MTVQDWIQLIIVLGGIAASVAVIIFSLGRKIGRLEPLITQALRTTQAVHDSQWILLGVLASKQGLKASQVLQVLEPFRKVTTEDFDRLISQLQPKSNPLTAGELERLRGYVRRVQQGGNFAQAEVQEFYQLAKKLQEEETPKTDHQVIFLVGLAAFMLGFSLGGRGK